MYIEELRTPAFLIENQKVKANTGLMIQRAISLGVTLRPHVKTHKTIEGTRLQLGSRFHKITVSTLAEAYFYAKSGFNDITYAFPITVDKFEDAARLTRKINSFNILVDQKTTVDTLQFYGKQHQIQFRTFLEIDVGQHRSGVNPYDERSIDLARQISDHPNTIFAGILTHGGQSYHCQTIAEVKEVAETERSLMAEFSDRLRSNGIKCPEVSIGSTPTCIHADNWDGITEIRPGNYIFFDKFQADIGSCTLNDCSATVLTRILGHYPEHNRLLIDAGAISLSKDQGATHINNRVQYGHIIDHPEFIISGLSQEHGFVDSNQPIPFEKFPVGSLLRIIPNHSCLSAALFPEYYLVEGQAIVDRWTPVRGW